MQSLVVMVMYAWDHKHYHKTFFPDLDFDWKPAEVEQQDLEEPKVEEQKSGGNKKNKKKKNKDKESKKYDF